MLIQTAERVHKRETLEAGCYWPRNAMDIWWQKAKRSKCPERDALDILDHWRKYATNKLWMGLSPQMNFFLNATGANKYARTLDQMSVAPLLAISSYRLLRGNYSGSAMSVVRDSDSDILQVGLQGGTLDVPSLLTHGAGTSERVSNGYDQSGNSNDLSAGGSDRPRIVNAGALDVTDNGVPSIRFDGSNDTLYKATLLGLSGSPALSVCMVAKYVTISGYLFGLGTGTTGSCFRPATASATLAYVDSNAANRQFTASSMSGAWRGYVYGKAASATVSAWTCRQDGVDLSQASVTNGSQALSLSGSHCHWGAVRNTSAAVTGWGNISSNFLAVFNAVLSGNDLLLIDREMQRHI